MHAQFPSFSISHGGHHLSASNSKWCGLGLLILVHNVSDQHHKAHCLQCAITGEYSLLRTVLISSLYPIQVLIWGLYSAALSVAVTGVPNRRGACGCNCTVILDLWLWSILENKPKMFHLKRFKSSCLVMGNASFYIHLTWGYFTFRWNKHVQHSYPRQNQGNFSAFYASNR